MRTANRQSPAPQREDVSTRSAQIAKPRKPRLNRLRILDAALELILDQDHEAFSMRALARHLNTGAATLYNHFASQHDIETEIVSRLIQTLPVPDPAKPARPQLIEQILAYRQLVHRCRLVDDRRDVPLVEPAVRLLDRTLELLTAAGIPIERAALAFNFLRLLASASSPPNDGQGSAPQVRVWPDELDREEFSFVFKLHKLALHSLSADEEFRAVLELAIDSLLPELSTEFA